MRLRPGTYACAHVDVDVRLAATAGARLDCVALLDKTENLWSGIRTPGLHVRAPRGRHVGALPARAVVHWSHPHLEGSASVVSCVDALIQAAQCLEPIDWLASVESALYLGVISDEELETIRALIPQRLQSTLARLDRGAQSGLETHTRSKIEDAGHHVETQVAVPGTSNLDLVVDGCVGVETDGSRWHADRFMQDRSKDICVEGWSMRVLRIGAPHIFETWPDTLATIETMIRDAKSSARKHL